MPYILLVLGLLIGLYALYRFFLKASVEQIKAFFLSAVILILGLMIFALAITGRLPAAAALLAALAPPMIGLWKIKRRAEDEAPERQTPPENLKMTRKEAAEILGVNQDAAEADIKAAYKKLMQKVHPDNEGSQWMAAKLNAARDVLLNKSTSP